MKLLSSETAVSEVIGHAIILSITVIGISMITLYGVPAILSLQDMANVKNVEQAFTVLDSRASRVTLGESPLQITNINLGGGTLTVEPNSTNNPSYMVVKSKNDTFNITIPMGKVKYTLGDRTVAYEGGGVWSQYPAGGSVMLSPPEVHFNGWTLTLPVIHIYGNASIGGKGTVAASFKKNATNATVVKYPKTTCPEADCANRTNPVNYTQTGKVYVNITSDYYLAWADYARSLVYTKVGVNDTTRTTDIELTVVPSTLGESTSITNPITFRGLDTSDPTPLENFSFSIHTNLNSLDWDIRTASGNQKLIFWLDGKAKDLNDKVSVYVGYWQQGYSKPAETWKSDQEFTVQSDGFAHVDMLNKSINLTYHQETVGSHSPGSCNPFSEKIGGGSDFNDTGFSWTDRIVNITDPYKKQSLYNVTQHYVQKMAQEGDISFYNCGPQTPNADSTMLQDYTTEGALTYLHITENRADVGIS